MYRVAGLWAGYNSLTQDFATVVWRQKLLGFNAVRLPFSFQVFIFSELSLVRSFMQQQLHVPTPCSFFWRFAQMHDTDACLR